MSRRRPAFTIIELMITISIILLLVAATIVGFARARISGRDTQRISDILSVAQAVDQTVLVQRGVYPVGAAPRVLVSDLSTQNMDLSVFKNNKLPIDPFPAQTPCADPANPTYLCGYTYNNRKALALSSSLARTMTTGQYEYVLEIGLEGDRFNDEQSIVAGPAGQAGGRTQFLYFGKYCGPDSSNNTCSIH